MKTSSFAPVSFALLVEGDTQVRSDAVMILEDAGFKVVDVSTGDKAIDLLHKYGKDFTLLFTAVELDGLYDGFELARKVFSDYPHMRIVAACGRHMPGEGDLPASACFIEKPFSAEVVHDHLRHIMPEDTQPKALMENGTASSNS